MKATKLALPGAQVQLTTQASAQPQALTGAAGDGRCGARRPCVGWVGDGQEEGRKRKAAAGDVATNRQASYRYHLLEQWECGMQLQGSEVKSIREGGVQIKDAYAALSDGEVWLHNMHIAPYEPASRDGHEPERPRKLLLHRREIERLIG